MRIGIVSMMRNPGAILATFVQYHRNIGFTDFIILFDDPDDPDIALAKKLEGVIAIPVDEMVRDQWRTLRHYAQCENHLETVGARQLLNIEYGFNIALETGVDWLLHIDIDEALFLKGARMEDHVELLENANKEMATYYNFEAIPERLDIDNYFTEVKIFKKPIKLLARQNISRSGIWPAGRRYFNFYNNGKSITKVVPGVYPLGAHRWIHDDHSLNSVQFFNPCVLHYSVCGYRYFEQKYHHRGNFSDVRINKDLRKNGAMLDLDARDAFVANDDAKARQIYTERIMMGRSEIYQLHQKGVLKYFDLMPYL